LIVAHEVVELAELKLMGLENTLDVLVIVGNRQHIRILDPDLRALHSATLLGCPGDSLSVRNRHAVAS
jgi:hypothetical protein